MFALRSNGLQTNRDAWNYNSSRPKLDENLRRMLVHYNEQVRLFAEAHPGLTGTLKARAEIAKVEVDLDPTRFSWDRANFVDVARGRHYSEVDAIAMVATYRPFHRRHVTAGRLLNKESSQLNRVYREDGAGNLTIGFNGVGGSAPFTPFITRETPDLVVVGAGNAMQWLPRYLYDESAPTAAHPPPELFGLDISASPGSGAGRQHNVTDHALGLYRALDAAITKDDIYFYVYGILHSPDYRTAFAADLKKSLPRIPQVATAAGFWAFSKAGRALAHLHTEYESVEPWPELSYTFAAGFNASHPDAYRVLKMKHPKIANPGDPDAAKIDDRSRIIYNDWITIEGIPERAYEYELGSRSAIAWVIESNRVKTDTASGIRNDPNDWATEHDDPTYILDLVGRVVTVSMRTLDIVESLPQLEL